MWIIKSSYLSLLISDWNDPHRVEALSDDAVWRLFDVCHVYRA